jgi:hypothetical protein
MREILLDTLAACVVRDLHLLSLMRPAIAYLFWPGRTDASILFWALLDLVGALALFVSHPLEILSSTFS